VSSLPSIVRVRHEPKRRNLTVTRLERLAAKMVRIVFGGHELPASARAQSERTLRFMMSK
jgi:NADPH-dependent ferric siderophore reductase